MIQAYGAENAKDHFAAFDTICDATQVRQDAVNELSDLALAGEAAAAEGAEDADSSALDFILVVGGCEHSPPWDPPPWDPLHGTPPPWDPLSMGPPSMGPPSMGPPLHGTPPCGGCEHSRRLQRSDERISPISRRARRTALISN